MNTSMSDEEKDQLVDKLEELIQLAKCRDNRFTAWEKSFILGFQERMEFCGRAVSISKKQAAIIENLYEDHA